MQVYSGERANVLVAAVLTVFAFGAQSLAADGPAVKFLRAIDPAEPLFPLCPIKETCGLIDITGKLVLEPADTALNVERDNVGARQIMARLATGMGVFDTAGRWLVEPKWDYAGPMLNGRARVSKDGLTSFVDDTGQEAVPARDYHLVGEFHEPVVRACSASRDCWLMDINGEPVTDRKYALIQEFFDGVALATSADNSTLFIEIEGEEHLPGNITANPFSEGLSSTQPSLDEVVYVDRDFKPVLQTRYAIGGSFQEGLAAVAKSGDSKFGYIDKSGKVQICFKFDFALGFQNGLAPACVGGAFGLVDPKGRWAARPKFLQIGDISPRAAVARQAGKLDDCLADPGSALAGIIDRKGNWIVEPKYAYLTFVDGLFQASNDDGVQTYYDEGGAFVAGQR